MTLTYNGAEPQCRNGETAVFASGTKSQNRPKIHFLPKKFRNPDFWPKIQFLHIMNSWGKMRERLFFTCRKCAWNLCVRRFTLAHLGKNIKYLFSPFFKPQTGRGMTNTILDERTLCVWGWIVLHCTASKEEFCGSDRGTEHHPILQPRLHCSGSKSMKCEIFTL